MCHCNPAERRKSDKHNDCDLAEMSRYINNLNYDEQRLVEGLEGLPHHLRVAFATACAERLLPAYTDFSERTRMGDSKELTSILERLWVDLEGDAMTSAEVEEAIAKCMTLVLPLENKPLIAGQTAAEDAGAALCYALRCRKTGDSQEAAWAGRRACEALDDFAVTAHLAETQASHAQELSTALREFLKAMGVSRAEDPLCDLQCLVEASREFIYSPPRFWPFRKRD